MPEIPSYPEIDHPEVTLKFILEKCAIAGLHSVHCELISEMITTEEAVHYLELVLPYDGIDPDKFLIENGIISG